MLAFPGVPDKEMPAADDGAASAPVLKEPPPLPGGRTAVLEAEGDHTGAAESVALRTVVTSFCTVRGGNRIGEGLRLLRSLSSLGSTATGSKAIRVTSSRVVPPVSPAPAPQSLNTELEPTPLLA